MFPIPFKTRFAFIPQPPHVAQADGTRHWAADIMVTYGTVYPVDRSKPRAAAVHGTKSGNRSNDARRTLVPVSVSVPEISAVRPEIALM